MFIASFNALVSIDATLLPVSNILYDIAFVAPPIAFASALFAFVFASTVPAKFITAMSELIPASINAAVSDILYDILRLFNASSITFACANVTLSVIVISTASFNPDVTAPGILLAESDILYTTAVAKSAIVFAFAIVEFPSTVTVPAVANNVLLLPAKLLAVSLILYVFEPSFNALFIIPACDTVASVVHTMLNAWFNAVEFAPAIFAAVSLILYVTPWDNDAIVFASAAVADVDASTVPASTKATESVPTPAAIFAAVSLILYVLEPSFVASSITFACANVALFVEVISCASFNPPMFATIFAAVSEILYVIVCDIDANVAPCAAFAVPDVTVPAPFIAPTEVTTPAAKFAAVSLILYVFDPLFVASSIIFAWAKVTLSVITIFTASFNAPVVEPGMFACSSDIL